MYDRLDRNEIISILETLGSENDEEVLAAARVLDTKVTAAGTSWGALLVPEEAAEEDTEEESEGESEGAADLPQDATAKNAETLALIGKLLARADNSKAFQEELADYKTDLAEGDFEDEDHRYIRAVYKRLSG